MLCYPTRRVWATLVLRSRPRTHPTSHVMLSAAMHNKLLQCGTEAMPTAHALGMGMGAG
jgi:hypothetical protein